MSLRTWLRFGLCACLLLFGAVPAFAYLPVKTPLVAFDSEAGRALLKTSDYQSDFYSLIQYFVTQKNLAYCGVASSVMVLNALEIRRPHTPPFAPYRLFTQTNFFTPAVEKVVSAKQVGFRGMTLSQLGDMLNTFSGVSATVYHADKSSEGLFKIMALAALKGQGAFIIVNIERAAMGETGGGHMSPLGAYDAQSDRFLLLDVSRYKYPPVWVTSKSLWAAMRTQDKASGQMRGFVVIKRD